MLQAVFFFSCSWFSGDAATAGAQIVQVDADAGAVVWRRALSTQNDEMEELTTYELHLHQGDVTQVVKGCTFKSGKKPCEPAAAVLEKEKAFAAKLSGDDVVAASWKIANNDEAVKGQKKAQEWTSPKGQHVALGMTDVVDGSEVGEGAGVVFVDVDGDRRFALPVAWTMNMGGNINAWSRLYCGDSRCVVVSGWVNRTGRGTSSDVVVSAPLDLASPPLNVVAGCASKAHVSVVANKALVSTAGQRMVHALKKAGCVVKGPDASQKARQQSAVYAKNVDDAEAKALAAAAGAASVEKLTWESGGTVVIALGAP